jgi:hypothetical protein
MTTSFDEAYSKYQDGLAKLDHTKDISQKNILFRQLAALLSDMEQSIANKKSPPTPESSSIEEEMDYWI